MSLRDRLDRIELLMDQPRFCGDDSPILIRIKGGLPEPLHAQMGGLRLEAIPGEAADEFEGRALDAAIEAGAEYLVVGGRLLPVG